MNGAIENSSSVELPDSQSSSAVRFRCVLNPCPAWELAGRTISGVIFQFKRSLVQSSSRDDARERLHFDAVDTAQVVAQAIASQLGNLLWTIDMRVGPVAHHRLELPQQLLIAIRFTDRHKSHIVLGDIMHGGTPAPT